MKRHSDISDTCQQALCVLLEKLRVNNCLIIGSDDATLFNSCPYNTDITLNSRTDYAADVLPGAGRYDFVLLLNLLESQPKKNAEHLIANLRDLHGGCFAIVYQPALVDAWQSTDLLALGLYQLPLPEQAEQVFVFDIHSYKQTPDWLNSQYWAHPELFDKYRW